MTLTYDVEYLKVSVLILFYFCVCMKQMSWIFIVVRGTCSCFFRGIDNVLSFH